MTTMVELLSNATGVILAITGLVGAFASLLPALLPLLGKPAGGDAANQTAGVIRSFNSKWMVYGGIGLLALTALVFVSKIIFLPEVTISNLNQNGQIELTLDANQSGSFVVTGTSARVYNNHDLRVYLLLHVGNSPGWWIQYDTNSYAPDQWEARVWTGDKQFPRAVGDALDVMVVVVTKELAKDVLMVNDPKDLNPVAQSDVIRVTVGSIK